MLHIDLFTGKPYQSLSFHARLVVEVAGTAPDHLTAGSPEGFFLTLFRWTEVTVGLTKGKLIVVCLKLYFYNTVGSY